MSVSEWETESERESSGEGGCERRLQHSYKPNFAIGQSLNGFKLFLSFICICLQVKPESGPFRILGKSLFYMDFSVSEKFFICLTIKSTIFECFHVFSIQAWHILVGFVLVSNEFHSDLCK